MIQDAGPILMAHGLDLRQLEAQVVYEPVLNASPDN